MRAPETYALLDAGVRAGSANDNGDDRSRDHWLRVAAVFRNHLARRLDMEAAA